jgi:hypothetical protein
MNLGENKVLSYIVGSWVAAIHSINYCIANQPAGTIFHWLEIAESQSAIIIQLLRLEMIPLDGT